MKCGCSHVITFICELLCGERYTAISRKVVGKRGRDNPERLCSSKKFERMTRSRGRGSMFASAEVKQRM